MTDDEQKAQDEGPQIYIHQDRLIEAVLRYLDETPVPYIRTEAYLAYRSRLARMNYINNRAKQ